MKTVKKTIFEVDARDLDDAVSNYLKKFNIDCGKFGYECVDENEWNSDESHDIFVDGNLTHFIYEKLKFENGEIPGLPFILNSMCREKLIEPGEYLIKV